MPIHLEVLSGYSTEVAPAVLLSVAKRGLTKPIYLLNAPEGLSRVALEHRLLRPSRGFVSGIFALSSLCEGLGDIGSVIFRSGTDGADQVQVVGPPSTAHTLFGLRHLMLWTYPALFVSDVTRSDICFADDNIQVVAVCLLPLLEHPPSDDESSEDTEKEDDEHDELDNDDHSDDSSNGSSDCENLNESPCGQTNHPSAKAEAESTSRHEVAPSLQFYVRDWSVAPRFVFKKPTDTFSQQSSVSIKHKHRHGDAYKRCVNCETLGTNPFVGYTVVDVSDGQANVIAVSIPCFHVLEMCNPQNFPKLFRLQKNPQVSSIVLHFSPTKVSKPVLQVPSLWNTKYKPAPSYSPTTSMLSPPCINIVTSSDRKDTLSICLAIFFLNTNPIVMASQRLDLHGRLTKSFPICSCVEHNIPLSCNACSTSPSSADLLETKVANLRQIVFFGTGSAEPSKCRGSSGILVRTSYGHFLLDCGAGVVNSMVHLYGHAGTASILCSLRMIWISHKHVDHSLGLLYILELRAQWADLLEPLLLVLPCQVLSWLTECCSLRPLRALQILDFTCISVQHCADAHAAVIRWCDGWSLAYSGDCRPNEEFVQRAHGVSVLIHEATFEAALHKHALQKLHSTTDEAVEVATRAECRTLILTHFSQRYSGEISYPRTGAGSTALIAFDGMHVSFANSEITFRDETTELN
eukprot:gene2162-8022_t